MHGGNGGPPPKSPLLVLYSFNNYILYTYTKFQISEMKPAQNLRWRQRSPHSLASQRKISVGLTLVGELDKFLLDLGSQPARHWST